MCEEELPMKPATPEEAVENSRPRHGPALWEKGGRVLAHEEALGSTLREGK